MIEITIKSNLSGREVKASYTARQLINKDEDQIVEEMTICDCQPIGETNITECDCSDEWDDYTMIVENENLNNQIIETIARNCIAWDTSKDKREGLLPEVAIFSNPYLYKKLTGKKYNFSEVCRKYHIDN